MFLERLDLQAERGRRHVQDLRRRGHAAGVGGLNEVAQLAQGHVHPRRSSVDKKPA